ncbi:MAG: cation diffusion facilitator family transporter [Microcystaceae cyanobacterium]
MTQEKLIQTNKNTVEEQAIKWGMAGTLFMASLGVIFALLTHSIAILLDGLFSLINLIIAFISLKVSRLIQQPDDHYYPFGYAIFEPLLNLGKGIFIALVCIFALFSAINSILTGGYTVEAGIAIWYALLAAVGCMAIALLQRKMAQKSGSPILEVDAQSWFMDGLLSGAVAIAFIIVLFLEKTPLVTFIPYADPSIVILLILASAPLPISIIKDNWDQVVGRSNDQERYNQICQIVEQILSSNPIQDYYIRQGNEGRLMYIQCYLLVSDEQHDLFTVGEQDHLRTLIYDQLKVAFPHLASDIIFTTDPQWIKRAIVPD